MLDWNINIHPEDLPKKLSELRFEVRKIRTYHELIVTKLCIMSEVLKKREAEMISYEDTSRKELDVELEKVSREIE